MACLLQPVRRRGGRLQLRHSAPSGLWGGLHRGEFHIWYVCVTSGPLWKSNSRNSRLQRVPCFQSPGFSSWRLRSPEIERATTAPCSAPSKEPPPLTRFYENTQATNFVFAFKFYCASYNSCLFSNNLNVAWICLFEKMTKCFTTIALNHNNPKENLFFLLLTFTFFCCTYKCKVLLCDQMRVMTLKTFLNIYQFQNFKIMSITPHLVWPYLLIKLI